MPATFAFKEDNGTLSSGRGTTTGTTVTTTNWKTIDVAADTSTNAYSANPITAPAAGTNYSMPKYQFGDFSGTFNQILNGKWSHTAGVLGTGITLNMKVSNTYATPALTAVSGTTDLTAVTAIASGLTVTFATTPNAAGSATLSAAGTTNYLISQLAVGTTATAGDTTSATLTLQYDEN